jgi:hypothetical protein
MSIFGRLGYSGNTQFNGADQLTPGVITLLNNQPQNLKQWQINDIANTTATGYYQNPHNNSLGALAVFVTGILAYSNTTTYNYNVNSSSANTMGAAASNVQSALTSFTTHTNNLSGVTNSTDISLYPDLNSALSIGRQVLNITYQSDGIQNNIPMIGNFSSLYIGNTLTAFASTIANDFIVLSNSIGTDMSGNLTSNISNSAMNTITTDLNNLQTTLNNSKNADISFYQNAYGIVKDYTTTSAFNNLGSTQNNLITLIGTTKLKTDLVSP